MALKWPERADVNTKWISSSTRDLGVIEKNKIKVHRCPIVNRYKVKVNFFSVVIFYSFLLLIAIKAIKDDFRNDNFLNGEW